MNLTSFDHIGSFYVFGGEKYQRQISKLVGFTLTNVGKLAFDHYLGSSSKMSEARLFIE